MRFTSWPRARCSRRKRCRRDKWVQATIQPFLSISPDGQVFAVQRTSTHWNRTDNPREMVNEIVVAEVEPLRFLQVVKPKSCSSLSTFAVNHHDGNVEVVGRWCGEWKDNTFPVTAEPKQ